MADDLWRRSASHIRRQLIAGEITPHDLLDALEGRIADVDDAVNALPTLCFERARAHADQLMAKPTGRRGLLAGLPVAIKDLSDVAGVRSTHGSTIFADHVPEVSAHVVERIEAAGGIVYAKSNTPEFGAGGNTFNAVFGATRNPWDLTKSAAGSSGGAAAALASGTAWLAQGSDLGGSLRNPASFCGIVGLRPSPGRVPLGPTLDPFDTLPVEGPMARCVDDVALFLDALSGPDPREPLSRPLPTEPFRHAAAARRLPRRIAWSPDLGITPVDPAVAATFEAAARRFEALGVTVDVAHPDLAEAHTTFQVLRAHGYARNMADLLANYREQLKPDVVWNIEKGLTLTSADVAAAEKARGEMFARTAAFFERYDLLLTPATIVPPYPVEERYVTACNGTTFETYVDWLAIAYAITLLGVPALSLPCGLTSEGLPVGLQIVGRPGGEAAVLSAAAALEDDLALYLTPIDPRG